MCLKTFISSSSGPSACASLSLLKSSSLSGWWTYSATDFAKSRLREAPSSRPKPPLSEAALRRWRSPSLRTPCPRTFFFINSISVIWRRQICGCRWRCRLRWSLASAGAAHRQAPKALSGGGQKDRHPPGGPFELEGRRRLCAESPLVGQYLGVGLPKITISGGATPVSVESSGSPPSYPVILAGWLRKTLVAFRFEEGGVETWTSKT